MPPVLPVLTTEQRWVQCRTPELFNDRIFTAVDWDRHVTWYRHLPEPLIFFRVFQAALPLVLWTTLWAVGVGLYAFFLEPHGAPAIVQNRNYAPVLQVASTALSLLLVFRTNSSYGRWQEGRQLFGLTLNYGRNLARLAGALEPTAASSSPSVAAAARSAAVRLSAAIAPSAASFLSGDPMMLRELCCCSGSGGSGGGGSGDSNSGNSDVLTEDEINFIERAAREHGVPAPIALAQLLSQLFARCGADSVERQAAEAQLSAFDVALGGCQRLAASPIPAAYTRHTSRFMVSYLMLLPMALFASLGWLTVAVVVLLTFFLGGVENVGVQIENPLRVLPMREMAAAYRDAALAIGRGAAACAEAAEAIAAGGGGRCPGWPGGGGGKDAAAATAAAARTAAAAAQTQQHPRLGDQHHHHHQHQHQHPHSTTNGGSR